MIDKEKVSEEKQEGLENIVLKCIQDFLKEKKVIIWGSGAVIDYGLPSMDDLKKKLKDIISFEENDNLEKVLGEIQDEKTRTKAKKRIIEEVEKKDLACLKEIINDNHHLNAIRDMIEKFSYPYPRKLDIITTNYDRVLEYALSKYDYSYTDGFTGKTLSKFNVENFQDKKIVNLIKVHGSLNWVKRDDTNFFLSDTDTLNGNNLDRCIVMPSKNKYEETHFMPYRDLLKKSDQAISDADSLLVVGFGFNDIHLTPKIEEKIRKNTPIVIITKKATDSCNKLLNNSNMYCLIEEMDEKQTKIKQAKIKIKEREGEKLKTDYKKPIWKLSEFMQEVYLK